MSNLLEFINLRFYLKSLTEIQFPIFTGTTLRGGFGYAFKQIACISKNSECKNCIIKNQCVYSYIFETLTPDNSEMMKLYPSVPHPYIIDFSPIEDRNIKENELFYFNMIFVGKCISYIPYFILAFEFLGEKGIGKNRGKFKISKIEKINPYTNAKGKIIYSFKDKILKTVDNPIKFPFQYFKIISQNDKTISDIKKLKPNFWFKNNEKKLIKINFITPTQIKYEDKYITIPQFHNLIRSMLRRISALSYFHCGLNLNELDFREIIKKSEEIKLKNSNLKWVEIERYSKRQNLSHNLLGFTGECEYEGENIQLFMPLLRLFSLLQIGKHTSFGQGKYQLIENIP